MPQDWSGERVFLVVGAADWETTAWLDGQELGSHRGGYTPFAFELTEHVRPGETQRLTLRVDDRDRDFKLEGKQGYGNARGIWQTVYLEARGEAPLSALHFTPDLANESVTVKAALLEPAPTDLDLSLSFLTGDVPDVQHRVPQGAEEVMFRVNIPDVRLWSLEDPFLYEVEGHAQSRSWPRFASGRQDKNLLRACATSAWWTCRGRTSPTSRSTASRFTSRWRSTRPTTPRAITPSPRTTSSATRSCARARSA